MSPRALSRSRKAYVVSSAPDVCLTPMGGCMVEVPYTITRTFEIAENTVENVRYQREPAFTIESYLPRVKGDEPGTGGGKRSGVNEGACRVVEGHHSGTVRAGKQWIVRDGDLMKMNMAGPDGLENTIGRVVFPSVQAVEAAAEPVASFHEEIVVLDGVPAEGAQSQLDAAAAAAAEAELAARKKELAIVLVQAGLDVAGIFDPTGAADIASGVLALTQGDWVGAGLSFLSAIPFADILTKGAKGARILAKIERITARIKQLESSLGPVSSIIERGARQMDEAAEAATKKADEAVEEAVEARKAAAGGGGSGAGTPSSKKPDPGGHVPRRRKVRRPGVSGKEGAKDALTWAAGEAPYVGENGKTFAKRLMDARYGPGNYKKGPGTEFNQIQKWGDRTFMDPK